MRIAVLANRDLASNIALNYLLAKLPQHQYRVFLSAKVGGNQSIAKPLEKLAEFEKSLLTGSVTPLSEPFFSNESRLKTSEEIHHTNLPVWEIDTVNSGQGLNMIAAGKPELIISIRFGMILKEQVIALPEFGVLNLHSGILPDYRGIMATFWSMLNASKEIGSTLHYILDRGIDTGDIIRINRQPIDYDRSYLWNMLSLYKQGVNSLVDTIGQIDTRDEIITQPQAPASGQYFGYPTEKNLSEFSALGLRLFDPQDTIRPYLHSSV